MSRKLVRKDSINLSMDDSAERKKENGKNNLLNSGKLILL